jgi:hypothetical protein
MFESKTTLNMFGSKATRSANMDMFESKTTLNMFGNSTTRSARKFLVVCGHSRKFDY